MKSTLLVVALLATVPTLRPIGAQERLAPVALLIPASTRSIAMAGQSIAGRDDDVVFHNPSQLVIARGTSLTLSLPTPSARGGSTSSVFRFGTGGIGVGVTYTEFEADATGGAAARASLQTRGPIAAGGLHAVVGIGQLVKGLRVGGAVAYAADAVGVTRTGRPSIDLGVSRDIGQQFTAAISLRHLDADLLRRRITTRQPAIALLGGSFVAPAGPLDIVATSALGVRRDGDLLPSAGLELGYSWLAGYNLVARAGIRRAEAGQGAATAGVGFTRDRVSLDYATELGNATPASHWFGIRIR
jgi:hypothetical protein